MEKIQYVQVKFMNYWKSYIYETKLPLKVNYMYKIHTLTGAPKAPVLVERYADSAPEGVELNEIIGADEVEDMLKEC